MTKHFDIVAYGANLAKDDRQPDEILPLLQRLEKSLGYQGYSWSDVSLLALFDSRWVEDAEN